MKINLQHDSDGAILLEWGQRLTRQRLAQGLSQATLAKQAGISKRTLERIEAGHPATGPSLIRILRVLDLTAGLDHFIPDTQPSPMAMLESKKKERQRAPRQSDRARKVAEPKPGWTWGDEK